MYKGRIYIKSENKGRIYIKSENKHLTHLCIVPLFLSSRQILMSCIAVGFLYNALSDGKERFKGMTG